MNTCITAGRQKTVTVTKTRATAYFNPAHSDTKPGSPINGAIHPLIPGRVLLFESADDDLDQGRMWADKDGRRYFSSAFYADLLSHLGAALVVSFHDTDNTPDNPRGAAYSAAGMGYCALGDGGATASASWPLSLQTLDRFVSLVAGCPGLVAVECLDDFHSGAAGACLAAMLLRRAHFASAAEAVAWMQIVCPGRGAGAVDVDGLDERLAHLGRLPRGRSTSLCTHAPAPLVAPPPQRAASSCCWNAEPRSTPRHHPAAAALSAASTPTAADRRIQPPAARRARATSSPHIYAGPDGVPVPGLTDPDSEDLDSGL
jgi:hypothetical protein